MSWSQIVGHDAARERVQRAWTSGRLASTWLFSGPDGIGKRTFALQLAKTLLCEKFRRDPFDSCDSCPSCHQVIGGSHPDLIQVRKPDDKSSIPLELLIGPREKRQEEGLCRAIALKPVRGMGKVALIDDADYLNDEGANALLKTLEEPPPGTILVLIGTSVNRQLPTILSRCQVVRFDPLRTTDVVEVLSRLADFAPERPLLDLARMSGGNVQQAILLNDPEVYEFRQRWLTMLAGIELPVDSLVKDLVAFAEAAGRENAARRGRLQIIADVATGFFEGVMLLSSGIEMEPDNPMADAAKAALSNRAIGADWAARGIERTLDFQWHVASNAGLQNAIEPWLDDLNRLLRGKVLANVDW